MVPDISSRITSILGSLLDVVQPAIDKSNSAAQEQVHLVIASLRVIQSQLDYAHAFELVDCKALVTLIHALCEILIVKLPKEVNALESSLTQPVHFTNEYRDANREMRDIVESLVEEAAHAADAKCFQRVTTAVLDYENTQIRRERAFVAGTGFDVESETLVTIEKSFGLITATSGADK
jgi:hypothetical protein